MYSNAFMLHCKACNKCIIREQLNTILDVGLERGRLTPPEEGP